MEETRQPANADIVPEKKAPGKIPKRFRRLCFLFLLPLLCLTVTVLVFHAVENSRGKRAWRVYEEEAVRKGEKLLVADFIPKPVPDEQNFAMAPLFLPLYENPLKQDSEAYKKVAEITLSGGIWSGEEPRFMGSWRKGERIDLAAWQTYFRSDTFAVWMPLESTTPAVDVLKALNRFDDRLAEVRRFAQRPYARFPICYGEEGNPMTIRLGHLSAMRNIARVLGLKAVAALEAGKSEAAAADIDLMLDLAHTLESDPMLLSQLVCISLFDMAMQPIWEGMQQHRWNTAQLERWKIKMRGPDLLKGLKQSMRMERAMNGQSLDLIRQDPMVLIRAVHLMGDTGLLHVISAMPSTNNVVGCFVVRHLVPEGWWYFEKANSARVMDDYILAHLPETVTAVDLQKLKAGINKMDDWSVDRDPWKVIFRHELYAQLTIQLFSKFAIRTVTSQNRFALAETALALEQFYLEHGTYPGRLEKLLPQFLREMPTDIIDRKALRYRKEEPDGFTLWSIGWDAKDDEGVVVLTGAPGFDAITAEEGDWVWPMKLPVKTIKK